MDLLKNNYKMHKLERVLNKEMREKMCIFRVKENETKHLKNK